ncbi:Hsp70 family protein [Mycolicibacterium cosmeticum]|uniref:Hsp70 family protein n=1 Tax=Mycolicibacterium cosmeticum TaxID=258533 RepID=UPI00320478E1
MTESVGLSIGATNLAAVTVGRAAVTRPAVLTRETGPVFTDFVDRVGDPVGLIAADGSTHRPEALLTEALRALHRTVPPGAHTGIGHPAHWHPRQVAALRTALAADRELRTAPLFSDAVTALAALSDKPGLPARGVVVLCDFGGTGTSITVADAANGYQPIAPTVRYTEMSGALIDQALLTHVLAGVPGAADAAGTSAIGSLTRLRAECRTAKERLSGAAAAAVPVDLPGHRTEVRVTRDELDAMLRGPLGEFLAVLRDTLQRSGIRAADLAAVASVGGGARIPAVTAALSEQFRVPVVTLPQPELAAAIGAGIRAARPAAEEGVTTVAPVAPVVPAPDPAALPAPDPAMSSTFRALAWSQDTDEVPGAEPFVVDHPIDSDPSHSFTGLDARPQVQFTDHEEPEPEPIPWYRRPALLIGAGAAVVLAVCVVAAVVVMRTDQAQTPTSQTTTATATANPATPSAVPQQPSPAEAPAPATEAPPQTRTVTRQAPVTQAPPPPATETPAPTSEAPPPQPSPEPSPSPEPTTEAPTTPPPLIPTIPAIPPIPTIPGLPPFIPQPGQQLPH